MSLKLAIRVHKVNVDWQEDIQVIFSILVLRLLMNEPQRLFTSLSMWYALCPRPEGSWHPNIAPIVGFVTNMDKDRLPSPVTPYYENRDALHYLAKETNADKHQIVRVNFFLRKLLI